MDGYVLEEIFKAHQFAFLNVEMERFLEMKNVMQALIKAVLKIVYQIFCHMIVMEVTQLHLQFVS